MAATLPIRLRIGDMPEDEIGTITLEPDGASVYEATAQALERAAVILRERTRPQP